jgi:hypothetical protein
LDAGNNNNRVKLGTLHYLLRNKAAEKEQELGGWGRGRVVMMKENVLIIL